MFQDFRVSFEPAGIAVLAIVLIRGIVLAATPLSFDEAYYWLWSKHLAAGYLDHPPLIAFLIRAGTTIFGDTSTGVRFVPWLLSGVASWAVWRAAADHDEKPKAGIAAALDVQCDADDRGRIRRRDSGRAGNRRGGILAAIPRENRTNAAAGHGGSPPELLPALHCSRNTRRSSSVRGFCSGSPPCPNERHWFHSPWPYAGALIAL